MAFCQGTITQFSLGADFISGILGGEDIGRVSHGSKSIWRDQAELTAKIVNKTHEMIIRSID